jgi:hypothetical protein
LNVPVFSSVGVTGVLERKVAAYGSTGTLRREWITWVTGGARGDPEIGRGAPLNTRRSGEINL